VTISGDDTGTGRGADGAETRLWHEKTRKGATNTGYFLDLGLFGVI